MTKLDSNSEVACQLYLITPPRIDEEELPQFLEKLENALKLGGVSCLQLRIKNPDNTPAPDMVIGQIAKMLVPLVQSYDVPVIMNDRPDLAAKYGCDGVHMEAVIQHICIHRCHRAQRCLVLYVCWVSWRRGYSSEH